VFTRFFYFDANEEVYGASLNKHFFYTLLSQFPFSMGFH